MDLYWKVDETDIHIFEQKIVINEQKPNKRLKSQLIRGWLPVDGVGDGAAVGVGVGVGDGVVSRGNPKLRRNKKNNYA